MVLSRDSILDYSVSVDDPVQKAPVAWEPLTRQGVAAFAKARWSRLLLVQLICAGLTACALVLFLRKAWLPIITQSIQRLPAQGEIRSGKLQWHGQSPVVLAENGFLAITVDLNHSGEARSPAHVQIEFGTGDCEVLSLLGYIRYRYETNAPIAFNRVELEPWWGAWAPPGLALIGIGMLVWLLASWSLLATLYCGPIWLIAFFANRDLSLKGSWQLSSAALLPGALFLTTAFFLYSFGVIDPLRLLMAVVIHFFVGWGYAISSVFTVPRHPAAVDATANPFGGAPSKIIAATQETQSHD